VVALELIGGADAFIRMTWNSNGIAPSIKRLGRISDSVAASAVMRE
jgi:hypothetical protein